MMVSGGRFWASCKKHIKGGFLFLSLHGFGLATFRFVRFLFVARHDMLLEMIINAIVQMRS